MTHRACESRLKKEGLKSKCCDCRPHKGCDFDMLQQTLKEELKQILLSARNGVFITPLIEKITALLSKRENELLKELEGMKVKGNNLEGQEFDFAEDGYNQALEDIKAIIKRKQE